MKKTIGGIVGMVLGAAAGTVLGGPLTVVLVAGLGGLGGYYAGSLVWPSAKRGL